MVVVVYILSLVLIGEYLLIAYGSRQHPNPFSSRSPALAGHHIPCTQKERRRTAHLSLSLSFSPRVSPESTKPEVPRLERSVPFDTYSVLSLRWSAGDPFSSVLAVGLSSVDIYHLESSARKRAGSRGVVHKREMGRSQRQLRAVLRKNWLLKIRHPFATCAEVLGRRAPPVNRPKPIIPIPWSKPTLKRTISFGSGDFSFSLHLRCNLFCLCVVWYFRFCCQRLWCWCSSE